MFRVERHRTKADRGRPPGEDGPLFLRGEVHVVGEYERSGVREPRLTSVRPAFFEVHKGRAQAVERFVEGRLGRRYSRRDLTLNPRATFEGASDQRRVAAYVRLVGAHTIPPNPNETGRIRRAQQQERDLGVPSNVVSEEERRIRCVQEDVHPASRSREVV